jgi:hypothetical protein
MGLTIHYKLSLPRRVRVPAHRLVARLHATAEKRCRAQNGVRVFEPTTDAAELDRWACAFLTFPDRNDPDTVHAVSVPPIAGCIFPVSISENCEPLWLGLCRYPATIQHGGRAMPTGQTAGWRFSGSCKTQYASVQGWEHFRRCHTTVVSLLRSAAELNLRVRIMDEGGWWPHRSDSALQRALQKNNQLVAALGGALKDHSPADEPRVASPIFAHPEFERLEAEGIAHQPKAVTGALSEIAKLRPRPRGRG